MAERCQRRCFVHGGRHSLDGPVPLCRRGTQAARAIHEGIDAATANRRRVQKPAVLWRQRRLQRHVCERGPSRQGAQRAFMTPQKARTARPAASSPQPIITAPATFDPRRNRSVRSGPLDEAPSRTSPRGLRFGRPRSLPRMLHAGHGIGVEAFDSRNEAPSMLVARCVQRNGDGSRHVPRRRVDACKPPGRG